MTNMPFDTNRSSRDQRATASPRRGVPRRLPTGRLAQQREIAPVQTQSIHDVAEMIATFRAPPGFSASDLTADIKTALTSMIQAEREACAKIASDRAAICQAAYDAGDKTEVHPLNEALHIAQLIRNRER